MLILNKKYYFLIIGLLIGVFCLIEPSGVVRASDTSVVQVKTKTSPVVYFLSNKYHLKKSYINSTAYLSYGNKWSDIKVVSASYLTAWPEAQLFRAAGTPNIYYVKGTKKTLIKSLADLVKNKFVGVPVLDVSAVDLVQYETLSYGDLGLTAALSANTANTSGSGTNTSNSNTSGANGSNTSDANSSDTNNSNNSGTNNSSQSGLSLKVYNDSVSGANNNSLVPGTNDNLLGVFRFSAPTLATITSLTFNLKGLYSGDSINAFTVRDASDVKYRANVSWRSSNHQIIINFPDTLSLNSGEELSVKILANLNTCADCNNQTLYLELADAAGVTASLPASAVWPLQGTQFKLVSNSNILGQVSAQMNSLASSSLIVTNGSRLIAKLSLSELSGSEDVLVKQLIFRNNGSANINDWQNFSLLQDNQAIARTAALDSNHRIVFDINYLRVIKGVKSDFRITAELKPDYTPTHDYNLQLTDLTGVGGTYNLSLNPSISNVNETFSLN